MEFIISIFASVGLLFIGLRLMSEHLRQLVGPRTRQQLDRVLSGSGSAALFGAMAGAIMQSVNAVAMLLVALVSAGATEPRKAFPIIGWANIGTSVLVLAATLNIKLLVLLMLSITGVAYYLNLDQSRRYRHAVGALLGISLLFLGISLIKQGVAQAEEQHWISHFAAMASRLYLLNFLIGAVLALLVHSATTITIIAMAMASSGVLQADTGGLIVVGATLGSALSVWILAVRLRGGARQIMVYQFVLKCCGTLAVLAVSTVDVALGAPLMQATLSLLGDRIPLMLAVVYVVIQVSSDVIMHFAHGPLIRLVERLAPPSAAEDLSRPEFLQDEALAEPATALLLVDKEQIRLIERLPAYLDRLRAEADGRGPDAATRAEADRAILLRCDLFLGEVAQRNHSHEVLERIMVLRDRNELIASLQETLVEVSATGHLAGETDASDIELGIIEALHMMLETFIEVSRNHDPDDLSTLHLLTGDRSLLMDRIRRRLIGDGSPLEPGAQKKLLAVTALFERSVWLLRRQVKLLRRMELGAKS